MNRTRVALLALAAALLLPAAAQAKTVTVKEGANRKLVAIKKGDVLRVQLEENPSTGYGWRRTAGPGAVLKYRGSKFFPPPVKPGRPQVVGEGGHRVFRFTTLSRGKTSFKLGLFPPGRRKPSQSYKLTVEVS